MGYVASEATTLAEIAGANFIEFTELSTKHGDGWGIATQDCNTGATLLLEPTRAKESGKYSQATSKLKSSAALLHLRWATLGLAINEGNTHPFTFGDISFIHNGGIMPPQSLDSFIDPKFMLDRRGDTDSERYFLVLISEIQSYGLVQGVLSGVRKIRDNCKFSSINSILLTPDKMIVICEFDGSRIPDGEGEDYYELFYRNDDKGVLIASSGWNQTGWNNLPNHQLMVVDRKTREIEIFSL